MRSDVLLRRHVRANAALRRIEVRDHDLRAIRREGVCDRAPDPLRAARDDRDLAVEHAHYLSGENDVGTRIRLTCVWISGWIFARNAFHASSACSSARRSSRSAYES